MKTLYLHIGTPKTATTAIQHLCQDNQEVLNKYGYCYPQFPYYYTNIGKWRNGHFLIGFQYDENGERDEKKEKAIYEEAFANIYACFEKYDNVILSDEGIWHYAYDRGRTMWKTVGQEARKGGFEVKVIVYLRRQDDFLFSWWSQQVKAGMVPSSVYTWEAISKELPFIKPDYCEMLDKITEHIDKKNIIVRRFDKTGFYGGSIYADFLHSIGLEYTDEFKIKTETPNLSLTKNNTEIKRILNTLPELDENSNKQFRKILCDCSKTSPSDSGYSMFSEEETHKFLARYEEGNRRIAKEYLGEDELFPDTYKAEGKWSVENDRIAEDIVKFVGTGFINLMQENEKLKKELAEQKKQHKQLKDMLKHPAKSVVRKLFRG